MKRIMVLVFALLLGLNGIFVPDTMVNANDRTQEGLVSEYQMCIGMIRDIETMLEQEKTSVKGELIDYKASLLRLKVESDEKVPDQSMKIDRLVCALDSLIESYEAYESDEGILIDESRSVNSIYDVAIAAVIAWFNNQEYLLSAELLTHAKDNTSLNSIYYPVHGNRVEYSSIFWQCHNNYSVSFGTGEFPNSGTSIEKDLYYAIHKFNWYRLGNSSIRIQDRYDFAYDKDHWATIQGFAVNVMYLAQQAGDLTPYYVYIVHS